MDWPGWKTALELWLQTPELIAATILVVLASFGVGWKARNHTATQREANLTDTITDLRGRLHDCREDLSGVKRELRETVHQAKEDQQRIANEVKDITRENSELRSRIKELEDTAGRLPKAFQEVGWVKITRQLADRSDTIDRHLTALSMASTTLEGTLSDLSKKLEVTEPDDGKKKQ